MLIVGLIVLIILLAKPKPGPGPGPDPDPPKPKPFDNISRKVPLTVKTTHFGIFESWFFMNADYSQYQNVTKSDGNVSTTLQCIQASVG